MASTTAPPRPPSRRFLPPDPRTTEPYRLTPQLAFRIAVLGAILVAAFAVLFLRLWALQVLSGSQYLNAAQNNQLRTVRIQAPRGPILDRNGVVLVENTIGHSVQIWPADLPDDPAERRAVLTRLSAVVRVPVARMEREIAEREDDPLTPVVVKRGIHKDHVVYINERQEQFQGVRIAQSYLRTYPRRALAAHLLGHVGEASEEQLERNPGLVLGDEMGQGGVEAVYDEYLRGTAGVARLRVDSLGRPISSLDPSQLPQPGNAVRLTIDARVQRAAEQALRYGIALAHEHEAYYANGGAVVALDPRDGQVLALASSPSFQPSIFVGAPDPKKLARVLDREVAERENVPSLNRATMGLYPPGSTWKPVTALAAVQEDILSRYEAISCTPSYRSRNERLPESQKQVFGNWHPYTNRAMLLPEALSESCDTYFYELGDRFYELPPERGHPFQAWAARFGFGAGTGIDVGPEADGLLPTPEWRRKTYEAELDRLWKPGDSIQLAIGQKDLQVTPLQMARFYALLANGGRLVTPHVVAAAEQPGHNGAPSRTLQRFSPAPPERIPLDQGALQAIREGLYLATHAPNGTSSGVFGAYDVPIAGKTGTAEKWSTELERMLDQSWWCGFGPYDDPEIVVCAVIENGGHGSTAAAPAALRVFEAYFGVEADYRPVVTETD